MILHTRDLEVPGLGGVHIEWGPKKCILRSQMGELYYLRMVRAARLRNPMDELELAEDYTLSRTRTVIVSVNVVEHARRSGIATRLLRYAACVSAALWRDAPIVDWNRSDAMDAVLVRMGAIPTPGLQWQNDGDGFTEWEPVDGVTYYEIPVPADCNVEMPS